MSSKVYVKGANGVKYEYENTTTWNKQTKKREYKRVATGMHIDPATGELVPNRKKGDAARRRAEAATAALEEELARSGVVVESMGEALLLDHVAEETGLKDVLRKVFPEDWAMILSCAYYLTCTGDALYLLEDWRTERRLPYGGSLASQRISELLRRITEGRVEAFFAEWARASEQDATHALDITSVSSYSQAIEHLEYGYNRDHEALPQVNMLLVTGSHTPLCYRLLPGSIVDVSALRATLRSMNLLGFKRLHLLLDRAFCSGPNLRGLFSHHMKFTMGMTFSMKLAREEVEKCRDGIMSLENVCTSRGEVVYGHTSVISWEHHRLYLHAFYNEEKAAEDHARFFALLEQCRDELESDRLVEGHQKMYDEYFLVRTTPKRGRRVTVKKEAVETYKTSRAGWFVLVSNIIRNAREALLTYKGRDVAEKAFDDLKNDLDLHRLRIHGSVAMHGRVFIQFVALILRTRLMRQISTCKELSSLSVHQVMRAMATCKEITFNNGTTVHGEATKRQRQIAACFGLTLPGSLE